MGKTIEEAANEYAANWEAKHNIHNPELYDLIVDVYKASAERMMSQPLASRLTAEEKERARKIYRDYRQKWDCSCNDIESERSFYCFSLLERIFGKELFVEE